MAADAPSLPGVPPQAPRRFDRSHAKPQRILIAEDEGTVRRFVGRLPRKAGYVAVEASDGLEAFAMAEALRPFDLLLTDLKMPRMVGTELAARLRRRDPELKVLYLTAYGDSLFEEKETLWQDEAFLDKPASVELILKAVSLLLDGSTTTDRASG